VIDGQPLAAYDPAVSPLERARRTYPFLYPPAYLFLVAPLGLLPSRPPPRPCRHGRAYLAAVRAIMPRARWSRWPPPRRRLLQRLRRPERPAHRGPVRRRARPAGPRPIAAGLLLAVLAYKPQFGAPDPAGALLTGRWRAFAAAPAASSR
jgi:hypothetical protein